MNLSAASRRLALVWLVAGWAGLAFLRCGQEPTSPPQSLIRLDLNDSIAKFDSVEIVLLRGLDTNAILQRVWNGPLPHPEDIPPIDIGTLDPEEVTVRVRGFDAAKRLVSETRLSQADGRMVVVHVPVDGQPPDTSNPVTPVLLTLSGLTCSPGTLTPSFSEQATQYQVDLPTTSAAVTLFPVAADARATLTIAGDTVIAGRDPEPIPIGESNEETAEIRLIHGDSSRTILVHISRYDTFGPQVLALQTEPNLPTPFDREVRNYEWSVDYEADTLIFTELQATASSFLKVNQVSVPEGSLPDPIALGIGPNAVVISVELAGQINSYFLNVTREPPPAPHVLAFETNFSGMVPEFHPDSLIYNLEVPHDSATLRILTLEGSDPSVRLFNDQVLDPGELPGPFTLNYRGNNFTFGVRREGVETQYTLTVRRREPPPPPRAYALELDTLTLTPAFHQDSTAYAVTLPPGRAHLVVTRLDLSAEATATLNGRALNPNALPDSVPVDTGSTQVTLDVKAGNLNQAYLLNVTRLP